MSSLTNLPSVIIYSPNDEHGRYDNAILAALQSSTCPMKIHKYHVKVRK